MKEPDIYRQLTTIKYVSTHSRHTQRNQGMELMKQWKNQTFIDNSQPLNMLEMLLHIQDILKEAKVMKLMNFALS